MAFKEWSTTYTGDNPVQDPDPITSVQPDVEDDPTAVPRLPGTGDNTRVSQIMTLRNKVQTIAKRLGDSLNAPVGSVVAQVATLETADTHTIHDNIDGEIAAIANEKNPPIATDWLIGEDSEDSNVKIKIQVGNLPGGISSLPLDTAGDLLTYDGAALAKVPVPLEPDLILLSDPTNDLGFKWGNLPAHADAHLGTSDPWNLLTKLYAWDPLASDSFGGPIAIDGNTLAVASNTAVYIFIRVAGVWKAQQKIVGMGNSTDLSLSGDTLACANYTYNSSKGIVYVYKRTGTTWALEQPLTHPEPVVQPSQVWFGKAIHLVGDTLIVGAPRYKTTLDFEGAVFVHTRVGVTWSMTQKLLPTGSEHLNGDYFGYSVSLDGSQLAIGGYQEGVNSQGAAYVFTYGGGTWTQEQRFVPAVRGASNHFGTSISLKGDDCMISEPYKYNGADRPGAVYYFRRLGGAATWTEWQILYPSDITNMIFGTRNIQLEDETFMVGGTDALVVNSNCVFYFKKENTFWYQKQRIIATDLATDNDFGVFFALSGDVCMMSAELDDDKAANAGAAYEYIRYEDTISVLNFAEYEFATTGAEAPLDPVSFALTSFPNGAGTAGTPSGYRILVFHKGAKLQYASPPTTSDHFYYDDVNNEIDILATGTADRYEVVLL
jgi:hypothetical protein